MSRPEPINLSTEEGEAIIARLSVYAPTRSDCEMLIPVVRLYFWLMVALQEAKLSLRRLRHGLFGKGPNPQEVPESEAHATPIEAPQATDAREEAARGDAVAGREAGSQGSPGTVSPTPKGGHHAGTGRLGADASVGAERVECRHEELAAGQRCPVCGQGTFYELPPGVEMRIDGHAVLSVLRYALHKLRCAACGQLFTAPLPKAAGDEQYSPRARAVLVVGRYSLGLPFYRIAGYQGMLGVPMPEATQWDQIEKVADCCYVVFVSLETLAAQGELLYQDDTSVRMVSLFKENQQIRAEAFAQGLSRAKERTGMFTTALVVRVGERVICLYYARRAHAGEHLAALVEQREADHDPPIVMSDALSRNEVDEGWVMRCHCLAHGRRQCSDIAEVFPSECRVVIDALKQVFDHEEEARDQQRSPQARLAYHQAYSQPLMDELKAWLDRQRADRLVEPHSSLGQAIASMQNPWATLPRFLSVPGAPLDNN